MGEADPLNPAPAPATVVPLMPAHLVGLGAFQVAALLLLWSAPLAAIPLGLFVLLMLLAPFVPGWRLFGPVLRRGARELPAAPRTVALTFDDGPHPETTPLLLEMLARRRVPACFFMVGDRAAEQQALVARLLAAGHELGNHSMTHDPLLMLRSRARLAEEIEQAQQVFAGLGVRPLAFRPPVGIVNPRLWPLLLKQGLVHVGFSCRAGDRGNRRVERLAERLLGRVRPGDVLLLHDGPVLDRAAGPERWLAQVEALVDGLQSRGFTIVPLSRLLGRPLMVRLPQGEGSDRLAGREAPEEDPVATFYDGLAQTYDQEQDEAAASPVRQAEAVELLRWIESEVGPQDRVLEIGAGTGRFTLPLARRAGQVTVVDRSPGMLELLRAKAQRAGLHGLETLAGDIRTLELGDRFDLVCAFSCVEYVPDLRALLVQLAGLLRPGGVLLLTTARRSWFRFFVQLGNAMRQGIWLHARSARELRDALRNAGLQVERTVPLGLRLPGLHGGMLLLAQARKPADQRDLLEEPLPPQSGKGGRDGSRHETTSRAAADRDSHDKWM